LLSL
jgi:hypothetical protein